MDRKKNKPLSALTELINKRFPVLFSQARIKARLPMPPAAFGCGTGMVLFPVIERLEQLELWNARNLRQPETV
jgi:hypothetical protein